MARPLRIVFPGAFYHITSRGNEQRVIFKSQRDRKKFLSYLESATQRYDALIHAYCLMDNHYHLLIETPSGNLPQIMRHINGAYTTYFNVKRKRSGHLLQGRYNAILVDRDIYAKELSRYIHLNPIRAKMIDKLEHYQWSSYLEYIGRRKPPSWLVRDFILSYFGQKAKIAQQNYLKFVEAKVGQKYKSPFRKVVGSTILGDEEFVKMVKENYLQSVEPDRDLPALRELSEKPEIEDIMRAAESAFAKQPRLARNIALFLCHRCSGKTLKYIGKHFGIGESAVSQSSRRMATIIDKDKKLKKQIQKVKSQLFMSKV